jgi:hypothetical protein
MSDTQPPDYVLKIRKRDTLLPEALDMLTRVAGATLTRMNSSCTVHPPLIHKDDEVGVCVVTGAKHEVVHACFTILRELGVEVLEFRNSIPEQTSHAGTEYDIADELRAGWPGSIDDTLREDQR